MDMSPLQNHDGVNAASALENLAHRLVAVHHCKTPAPAAARRGEDVTADLPIFSESEFGLDLPPRPDHPRGFLDRIRQWFLC